MPEMRVSLQLQYGLLSVHLARCSSLQIQNRVVYIRHVSEQMASRTRSTGLRIICYCRTMKAVALLLLAAALAAVEAAPPGDVCRVLLEICCTRPYLFSAFLQEHQRPAEADCNIMLLHESLPVWLRRHPVPSQGPLPRLHIAALTCI